MPKVSVVMAAYNAQPYVSAAVESVLGQSFQDFEFIIIDDGSFDGTRAILEKYAGQDRRIRLFGNSRNLGLIASLNKGVRLAGGDYVARQDADDVSLPQRFALQVNFLDANPEVGVLGTWMLNADEAGRAGVWRTPVSHAVICWFLLFGTRIAHATTMMRRALLVDESYRSEMIHAEDYDLWSRLGEKTQLANLPICLYRRRIRQDGVCARFGDQQQETVRSVSAANIKKMIGPAGLSDDDISNVQSALMGCGLESKKEIQGAIRTMLLLYHKYSTRLRLLPEEDREIRRDVARRIDTLVAGEGGRFPFVALWGLWRSVLIGRRISVVALAAAARMFRELLLVA